MTCQECIEVLFEEESGGEVNRVALLHLNDCEDCRDLAREIRANAAALREMRDDPLPESRSKPQIAAKRGSISRYLYPLAAAAALIAAVGLSVWRLNSPNNVVDPTAQASRPKVATVMPTAVAEEGRRTHRALAANGSERPTNRTSRDRKEAEFRRAANMTPRAATSTPPAPIKMQTDDPNVVIYLVLGDSGVEPNSEGELL